MPLTPEENGEMINWVYRLPLYDFSEAVNLLIQGPAPTLHGWPWIDMFKDNELPEKQPGAVLTLVNWILQACDRFYGDGEKFVKLLEKLPHDPNLFQTWEAICQKLNLLGLAQAQGLVEVGRQHFLNESPSG